MMSNLILTEIYIYPIKSLGGIRLDHALVMEKGLQYDRRWMLVDEKGTFLTQRIYPRMALFKLSLKADSLSVSFSNQSIDIPFNPSSSPEIKTVIWDDQVHAVEVDPAISTWFTTHMGMRCKLVYFPEDNPRAVDPRYAHDEQNVSLADAYPYLIIGEASLADLNARLNEPVPMNRFRPNFVFSGGTPFEEDEWKKFRIGNNHFTGVKLCARCVMTTVDQETAQQGSEPLKTLASYRKINNKVMFGQNLLALDYTSVKVGDAIEILEREKI